MFYLKIFLLFQLTINVENVNDNAPQFDLPEYQVQSIQEDVPIGTSLLRVSFFLHPFKNQKN